MGKHIIFSGDVSVVYKHGVLGTSYEFKCFPAEGEIAEARFLSASSRIEKLANGDAIIVKNGSTAGTLTFNCLRTAESNTDMSDMIYAVNYFRKIGDNVGGTMYIAEIRNGVRNNYMFANCLAADAPALNIGNDLKVVPVVWNFTRFYEG